MNCIQCGKPLAPDEKFCGNCGTPRSAIPPPPPRTLPETRTAPVPAPMQTHHRSWTLPALLLVIVCAGLAGAGMLYYLNRPAAPGAQPAASVPTVAVPVVELPTPMPTATNTPQPTATFTPTPVPELEVVFSDDFTTGCSLPAVDDANNTMKCENGAYTLLGKAQRWTRLVNYTQPYTNAIMEASATTLSGSGAIAHGLIFGVSSDAASGYVFMISQRGDYIAYSFSKAASVSLIPWTPSLAVKTGASTNRLKVIAQGNQLAFYVNDQWLNTVVDPAFSGGRFGFILSNDAVGAKVGFDTIRVTQINRPLDLPRPLPATATATETATRIPASPTASRVPPTATNVPPTATPSASAKLRAQLDEAWGAGDWQRVITLIEALRVLDPTDLQLPDKLYAARVNYGLQLLDAGNLQGALSQCQAALVLNPSGGEALQCVARAQPKPTATATRVYVPPPPPSATPTNIYVLPTATPPNPYTLYLTVRGYEQWGRPNPSCSEGFNDKSPVRRFTVDFTLVNGSAWSIDDWFPTFYAGGRQLYTCYYGYNDTPGVPSVPPGGTRTVTFAAFAELSEYVTRMSLSIGNQQFQRCFAPYDGHEVPCQ